MICCSCVHTEFSIEIRLPYVICCRKVIFFKKKKYSSNRAQYYDLIYSRFVYEWLWFDINCDYDFNLCSTWITHEIKFCRNHSINRDLVQDTNATRITHRPLEFVNREITKSNSILRRWITEVFFHDRSRSIFDKVSIINTLRSLMISSSNFVHQFETVWLLLRIQVRSSNIFLSDDAIVPVWSGSTTNSDDDHWWYHIFHFNWHLFCPRIQWGRTTKSDDFITMSFLFN